MKVSFSNLKERLASTLLWSFILMLSVFRLSTIYHEYVVQFAEGPLIETITYFLSILISLWFLNQSGRPGMSPEKANLKPERRESLAAEFADGFLSSIF